MLSLVKDKKEIYRTNYVDELIRYLENQCTESELKDAREMFKIECLTEFGRMWHLCLIDNCERLEGVSLMIHKEGV